MGDPGDEQIIPEDAKLDIFCGGCNVKMDQLGEGKHQCPNCKRVIGGE